MTLPQDVTFATDSYAIYPELTADLMRVSGVLNDYPDSEATIVTKMTRKYMEETVKSLEYSKNLPRLQAF